MELVFLSHASSGAVLLPLLTHVILKRSEEMLTKLHEKRTGAVQFPNVSNTSELILNCRAVSEIVRV